jgi:hypothetical protein
MVTIEPPPNASLAEILRARAQRTPHDRLLIDIVGGVLLVAAAVWARPAGWVAMAAAAACFFCYGGWAIADKHLRARPWPESVPNESFWNVVRGAMAVIGIAAFALLLLATLGIALGPIKS